MNRSNQLQSPNLGNPQQPLVSIIIATFNSMSGTKNIQNTLQSIKNQTYHNIETLVIDNFSADSTSRVCESFGVRFFSLHEGRSQARNFGIRNMRGKYALFVDSDHVLSKTMVEDCVDKALRLGADCVLVPVIFVNVAKTLVNCSKMRNLEFKAGFGTQSLMLFYSAKLIGHIEFPLNVDLFEDMIFSSRVLRSQPVISNAKSYIYHVEDGSINKLILRSWGYGKKFRSTLREIGSADSTHLITGLSALNFTKIRKTISSISDSLNDTLSFLLYIIVKHMAFAIANFFSLIS